MKRVLTLLGTIALLVAAPILLKATASSTRRPARDTCRLVAS